MRNAADVVDRKNIAAFSYEFRLSDMCRVENLAKDIRLTSTYEKVDSQQGKNVH